MDRFSEYGYDLPDMLMREEMDVLDTWDVQVCFAECRFNMKTLYPRRSKCINIGVDGTHISGYSEEHCADVIPSVWKCNVGDIIESERIDEKIRNWFGSYDLFISWKNIKPYRKYIAYNYVLNKIIQSKQEDIKLEEFFVDHEMRNIAIYGLTDIGKILKKELETEEVSIVGFIDKDPQFIGRVIDGVKVFSSPKDVIDLYDCVVITPLTECYEIKKYLTEYINKDRIFTIAEVLR